MARRDTGTDDPRVRVRAGKGSRPRTKDRPDWSSKPLGRVIGIDRGRYQVSLETDGTRVVAVRARELGRDPSSWATACAHRRPVGRRHARAHRRRRGTLLGAAPLPRGCAGSARGEGDRRERGHDVYRRGAWRIRRRAPA